MLRGSFLKESKNPSALKTLLKTELCHRQNLGLIRNVLVTVAGILLFAIFVHDPGARRVLAFAGLVVSAVCIGYSTRHISLLKASGMMLPGRRTLLYILPALLLGALLGIATRNRFGLSLIPLTLGRMALIAPCIGAFEEILFRGYIQGTLQPAGKILSVVVAAMTHSAYKLLLIYSFPGPLQFDLFFLGLWTFTGGLAFGILKELSGNTFPPVISHALFDIILYGGLNVAPAWIWS
ncbi:MAG: CPBP family intramembrane glutamic endopeptidase [Bacteroidota bacterium]